MIKSQIPLLMFQTRETPVSEKCEELNKKIFENIIILNGGKNIQFESYYKHMSSNDYNFEIVCFLRYFYILNFIKSNKIDKFLYCDSDAVFLKYLDFEGMLGKEKCLACKPKEQEDYERVVSAHFSIWTDHGLDEFCDFLFEVYNSNLSILEDKWEWHKKTNSPGGICDMTLLYHWYESPESLLDYRNEATFDRGISSGDNLFKNEFAVENGIKKIFIDSNRFFGKKTDGNMVEFLGLHFQGNKKNLIFSI